MRSYGLWVCGHTMFCARSKLFSNTQPSQTCMAMAIWSDQCEIFNANMALWLAMLFCIHGHWRLSLLNVRWFSVYSADTCVSKLLNFVKNDRLSSQLSLFWLKSKSKKEMPGKTWSSLIKNFELVLAGGQNGGREANTTKLYHSWTLWDMTGINKNV